MISRSTRDRLVLPDPNPWRSAGPMPAGTIDASACDPASANSGIAYCASPDETSESRVLRSPDRSAGTAPSAVTQREKMAARPRTTMIVTAMATVSQRTVKPAKSKSGAKSNRITPTCTVPASVAWPTRPAPVALASTFERRETARWCEGAPRIHRLATPSHPTRTRPAGRLDGRRPCGATHRRRPRRPGPCRSPDLVSATIAGVEGSRPNGRRWYTPAPKADLAAQAADLAACFIRPPPPRPACPPRSSSSTTIPTSSACSPIPCARRATRS